MNHARAPGGFDLSDVLAAARMISGEVVLERLLAKLMQVVIESARAQRGLLILVKEGRLVIEAEGTADRTEVLVLQSVPVEPNGRSLLPAAIVNHVACTRESVILDDAAGSGPFSSDPYVIENQSQSILCMPLDYRDQLVGILYLENDRSPGVFTPNRVQVAEFLSTQAAISIEHVRLLGDAQRRVQEVETLYEVGTLVAATLRLEEAIERILEQLARVVAYDSATVQLLRGDHLEIVGGRGWEDPAAVKGLCFPVPGDNPNTVVIEQRQPHILDDAPAVYPSFCEGASCHVRSWLGVPLIIHDRVIGMLTLDSTQPDYFNAAHARLATAFAAQVAVALQNAQLYDAARQRATELETLRRTSMQLVSSLDLSAVLDSIAEGALALVGATDCLIYLYDRASESFSFGTALGRWAQKDTVLTPRQGGLTATVVRQGRPVVIDDAVGHPLYSTPEAQEWKIQAIAGFPLQRAGQVLGVLHIAFVEPHTFVEGELRVLGLLADQAAIAIENARLFEAERAQLAELTVLHAVTISSAEADREDVLIEDVTKIIGETLYPADVFGVMLLDEAANVLHVHPSYNVAEHKEHLWRVALVHLLGEDEKGIPIPVGQGITGTVAATGRPWRLGDVTRVPEYIDGGVGTRSELCVPLKVGERVIGVINAESTQRDAFSEADERLLATVAGQLATAIEKMRLYEEAQRELAERVRVEEELRKHRDHLEEVVNERTAELREANAQLQQEIGERAQAEAEREQLVAAVGAQAVRQAALLRLSAELAATLEETQVCRHVVDGLHDTLGYDFVAIYLLDRATGERVHAASIGFVEPPARFAPGEGLSERPLMDGRLQYTPDVAQAPQYFYGMGGSEVDVPVRIGGEVLGVLVVESRQRDAFDQNDFEVLTAAAQQAGLAIENARLYDQAQREIAERKRAEEALRTYQEHLEDLVEERTAELKESEKRYRSLFDGVPVGLYRSTPEGQVLDANLANAQMFGFPSQEKLLACNVISDYVDPKDRVRWQALMEQEGEVRDFEAQMYRQDGTVIWVNDNARAVTDEGGQVLYYEGSLEDITERKRAEAELRKYQEHLEDLVEERTAELQESEERYRTLFDGVPAGLYRTTPSGQILDANLAAVEMLGYPSRQDLLGASTSHLFASPMEAARARVSIDRGKTVRDFEMRLHRYDGTVVWMNYSARAVRDEQGQVLYYEGAMQDITERKRAEAELRKYQEQLEELVEERTAELRESEERYRTLFDGVPVGLYRSTPSGQIVDANSALVEMLGFRSREDYLTTDSASLYVDPEDRVRWQALMEREATVRDFEVQLQQPDGTVIWIFDTARAVRDEQGQVLYYEGSVEDITERKQAQQKLEASEEQYRTLYQATRDAVMLLDDKAFFDCNPATLKIFGCETREQFIGRHPSEFSPEYQPDGQDSVSLSARRIETALRKGSCFFEWQHKRLDGTEFPAEVLLSAMEIRGRKILQAVVRDITERKQAEAELRKYQEHLEELVKERTAELQESEERYRTLVDGVPVGIYRTTPAGQVLEINRAGVEMFHGPSREETMALSTASLYVDPQDRVRWQTLMEREGVVRDFEARIRRYDGTVMWVNDSARAVKDEHDQVLYYEGSLEDISKRKEFEEEIRRQKDYYEALFVNSPVAVVTADLEGKVLSWNPEAEKLFGYAQEEVIGASLDDVVARQDPLRAEAAAYTQQVINVGRIQATTRRSRKDGSLVDVELLALPMLVAGERVGFIAIYHDITERKRIERELRYQKEYFEALFVNSPAAVVAVDMNLDVVSWNPAAEELFGYTEEEVLGRNLDDVVASDPGLHEEALHYTEKVRTTQRIQATTKRTRKDGSLVDVEALALPVIVGQEIVGYIGIYVDIADLQQARREAEAASQAKGAFLANMSHELRTPLNAILGFTQLMDGDPNLTPGQQENLAIINHSGEHLLALINDVLEMSKIEAGRVTLQEKGFDLYDMLDSLEEMFRLRAGEKELILSVRRAEEVPRYVRSDEAKLRQVLSNLLGNAVKFTQEGSVALRVGVAGISPTPQYGAATLHFEVEDTGPGIAPEELELVFDPFVQASAEQQPREGTGLGLSISRQYVRLMGGDLVVSSELGHGSFFSFDVQVGLADAAKVEATWPRRQVLGLAPDQRAPDGGPYRLLIVEDRETNRQLLVKLLAGLGPPPLGFEVQEAVNGKEAVEMWERWEPHLIWMDMRMPIMDGHEATQRIKATPKGQETVIIALTATAFEEDREEILAEGCDDFVRKPFRKNEIFDMLAKHLGVRFIYEEEPGRTGAVEAAGPDMRPGVAPPAEALSALPSGWRTELQQATMRADLNQMLNLIEQIRDQNPDLADALAHMALNFEYRVILTLIEKAGGET
jgi:PAS domain S-box-containing protein